MEQYSTSMSDGRKIQDVIKDRMYQTQERLSQHPVGSIMYNKYWDDLQILREAQRAQTELDSAWDKGRIFGYDQGYDDGHCSATGW